jgi:hypothetical protein
MRPIAVVLTLTAVVAAGIGGVFYARSQNEPAPTTEKVELAAPDGPLPKAVVDEDTYDFGVMELHTKQSHDFVIRNEGVAPLKLAKGESTCKCTLSDLAKKDIPPGEEAIVTLTWEPKAVQTDFEHGAKVITNEPDPDHPDQNRIISLTVMGNVVSSISLAPSSDWSVGVITENERPGEVTGHIYSELFDKFEIKSIEGSSEYLTAEATPLTDQEKEMFKAKSGYSIHVILSNEIPVGRFQGTLKVKTDVKDGVEFNIPILATRTGPVHVIPGADVNWIEEKMMLRIPRFPAAEGKKTTLSVFIRDPDGKTEISKVETANPLLHAMLVRDEKFGGKNQKRYELKLEIPAGRPPAQYIDDSIGITMYSNHPKAKTISLGCQFISY